MTMVTVAPLGNGSTSSQQEKTSSFYGGKRKDDQIEINRTFSVCGHR